MRASMLAVLIPFSAALAADPALTIYNQGFAVVRETIPLELKAGVNTIQFAGATAHLEPDSVILRDPTGQRALRILEQNYRADPVSMNALLAQYEGKTIEFLVREGDQTHMVAGKVIRAAAVADENGWFNASPYNRMTSAAGQQPVIEVDGKLRFGLPGVPLFPALGADTILKPTLDWKIQSDKGGKFDAELGYVSNGFNWEADYNVIAPKSGNTLDLIGWVTLDNQSGKTFDHASIKLMAGDVNKIQPPSGVVGDNRFAVSAGLTMAETPPVTEKNFDEYHLYTLPRPTTLHDRETKQVEFLRATGIHSDVIYTYDGAKIDNNRYRSWQPEMVRNDSSFGTQSNTKVWVMREFTNSDANHLGMPMPKGRVRFYRRDDDGRLEFTGEDTIDHTPRDEKIRIFTGAAFDLTGERKRVMFRIDHGRSMLDEAFEIRVRNHKSEPVEIRVVEHLYRWNTWEIETSSMPYEKTDAQTIQFKVPLQPGEEKLITYTAHYTW